MRQGTNQTHGDKWKKLTENGHEAWGVLPVESQICIERDVILNYDCIVLNKNYSVSH